MSKLRIPNFQAHPSIKMYRIFQMSPVENSTSSDASSVPPGSYQLVAWDLDTTGRRLIDEICQIGGYYLPAAAAKNETKPDNANGKSVQS